MKDEKIYRGDIYLANLNPYKGSEQGGKRPVIIIQNDVGNHYSPTVIVTAVTSRFFKKRALPMLSLSGVYLPGKNEQDFRIPASLERFLREYPDTKAIYLHLDSDYAGRRGAAGFITVLGDRYDVRYLPPKYGKDYNDYLMHLIHLENLKTERTQKNELRKEKTEPR